ncbi:site-specific integrase [Desulfitobacterium metallireducens]|uniref:Integrase n=1 Tax=Desulfitobacterium metallireducens DSM 15288 TaxID=871968 RepID=W0E8W4_9FIRM|nr:site-specific integrase [Desulfitobacterium metallireducens]AHF07172.1 integrase [Desulfitobacterium metallireducens DSM 15288]
MNLVQPLRNKQDIDKMKSHLKEKNPRDYVMFMIGISSALRISDILGLKVSDVWDGKRVNEHIDIREKKTDKGKIFAVSPNLEKAIRDYIKLSKLSQNDYLITSNKPNKDGSSKPISRQQAHEIISNAADYLGIKGSISTHTMRKTWGYWAYKSGVDLALIMEALNHSSIAMTKKYIGITQDDLDEVYIKLNL